MKLEQVKDIANAVLYEGYLLYPYRRSAIKNRQRWTFGVVYPRMYSEANGPTEPWTMQTECLVAPQGNCSLDIYVRFLHLLKRTIQSQATSSQAEVEPMGQSRASQLANEPWEEGIEREVALLNLSLSQLTTHNQRVEIAFPANYIVEEAENGSVKIVREQQALTGAIIVTAERMDNVENKETVQTNTSIFKLAVSIENTAPAIDTATIRHNTILLQSFISTHTILQVHNGAFISLLETPEELSALAQGCQNHHTWPVLVGNEGEQDVMLSSPIILYDYPRIAPESPGSLFDGTEIDEILTLRIMTLTDEEKQEMRQGDERALDILERTEALSPEQFMKLHGTIRNLRQINEGGKA